MINVTEETLRSRHAIVIHNVVQGLKDYSNSMLSLSESGHREFINTLMEQNGEENCFADFYYFRLNETEQAKVLAALEPEQREYVLHIKAYEESVYYQLDLQDSVFVDILCKLNAAELLFCTFYFTKFPCTIWGNYSLEYPIFWDNAETRDMLQTLENRLK